MNQMQIEAVQYAYGMSKKEARQYIKNATLETVAELVAEYTGTARAAFYND